MKILNKITTGMAILFLAVVVWSYFGEMNPGQLLADIYRMSIDTDDDGLPDGWEVKYFGTLAYDARQDFDSDGLSNGNECRPDFVFDDGHTFNWCTTNGDGIFNVPVNPDSDHDGVSDGDEFYHRETVILAPEQKSADQLEKVYADVNEKHYYFEQIRKAQEMDVIPADGIFHNLFRPDAAMKRAEALAFLVKARGIDISGVSPFSQPYSDTAAGWWDVPYIVTARENGFVPYVPVDNTLRPGDDITRSEFLEFIFAAFDLAKTPESEIPDYPFVDVAKGWWDVPYIVAANELGIMKSLPSGRFMPRGMVRRGEAMAIILRAMEITNPGDLAI